MSSSSMQILDALSPLSCKSKKFDRRRWSDVSNILCNIANISTNVASTTAVAGGDGGGVCDRSPSQRRHKKSVSSSLTSEIPESSQEPLMTTSQKRMSGRRSRTSSSTSIGFKTIDAELEERLRLAGHLGSILVEENGELQKELADSHDKIEKLKIAIDDMENSSFRVLDEQATTNRSILMQRDERIWDLEIENKKFKDELSCTNERCASLTASTFELRENLLNATTESTALRRRIDDLTIASAAVKGNTNKSYTLNTPLESWNALRWSDCDRSKNMVDVGTETDILDEMEQELYVSNQTVSALSSELESLREQLSEYQRLHDTDQEYVRNLCTELDSKRLRDDCSGRLSLGFELRTSLGHFSTVVNDDNDVLCSYDEVDIDLLDGENDECSELIEEEKISNIVTEEPSESVDSYFGAKSYSFERNVNGREDPIFSSPSKENCPTNSEADHGLSSAYNNSNIKIRDWEKSPYRLNRRFSATGIGEEDSTVQSIRSNGILDRCNDISEEDAKCSNEGSSKFKKLRTENSTPNRRNLVKFPSDNDAVSTCCPNISSAETETADSAVVAPDECLDIRPISSLLPRSTSRSKLELATSNESLDNSYTDSFAVSRMLTNKESSELSCETEYTNVVATDPTVDTSNNGLGNWCPTTNALVYESTSDSSAKNARIAASRGSSENICTALTPLSNKSTSEPSVQTNDFFDVSTNGNPDYTFECSNMSETSTISEITKPQISNFNVVVADPELSETTTSVYRQYGHITDTCKTLLNGATLEKITRKRKIFSRNVSSYFTIKHKLHEHRVVKPHEYKIARVFVVYNPFSCIVSWGPQITEHTSVRRKTAIVTGYLIKENNIIELILPGRKLILSVASILDKEIWLQGIRMSFGDI